MNRLVRALSQHSFVRFAFIGGCGYFVNAAVLAFATDVLHLAFDLAIALSILVAMGFTWLGNRYLTFRERRARGLPGMAREGLKFLGANALGAVVNYAVSIAVARFAPPPFNNKYVAQACGVLAGLVFNFTLSSKMVFRHSR